ncbi:MAG: hypothetical protein WBA74_21345 [Cyclobacteriaceae bacterium]
MYLNQNPLFCQTQTNIEEHNWKVIEMYADSILLENDPIFLRFSSGGTLMSDEEKLTPDSPQFQQRSVSSDSYALIDSPTYLNSTPNTLQMIQDDETSSWDIVYEDINTLVLFKYDTIPATSMESGQPYIYPLELRLVKDDK